MKKNGEPPLKELKYYGIHACLALFKMRADDIIRVYVNESNVKTFTPLLKWCAKNRKAYHIVPNTDLDKITDSVHHEGVAILARELPFCSEAQFLKSIEQNKGPICLIYLDQVGNPHNLGSILRTAAHFGISYILGADLPPLSPSACRIAKGAAEMVRLVSLKEGIKGIQNLKNRGFYPIGTSSHKGESLYRFSFPSKTIFLIGSESDGLAPQFLKLSAASIQIPGSGQMESLNVSVATALCVAEFYRQHL